MSLFSVSGHTKTVYDVDFSPNGDRILSGSHDGTVKLWDSQTGEHLLTLEGLGLAKFSPHGKVIVSLTPDGMLKVFEARTRQKFLKLEQRAHSARTASAPAGRLK